MQKSFLAMAFAVASLLACAAVPAARADAATGKHAASSAPESERPALPFEAHKAQSVSVDGHTLKYTVTVGWLPVRDDKGKTIAQVVYTAYTAPGKNRPVTSAFNGGPGASSVFLNFGAIGPKIVKFGVEGDTPSEPARLHDNPNTWLPFTDLVFVDPVGTGYSRSLEDDKQSTKDFHSTDADTYYLSRVVYDGRYNTLSYDVGRLWHDDDDANDGSVKQLREAVATDPKPARTDRARLG